ncbi:response regulator transcription factor, partial [Anaerosporobacter sp.]|uniref:response regulator transcription factor n=1 Tax=Anaerosporobacter sp. TaxID=1872529 RepID=UPI00286F596D
AKIMEEYIIVKKVRIFQQLFDKDSIDKEEKNHIQNNYSMYLMIEDGGKHNVLRCSESLIRDFGIECELPELQVAELVELLTQEVFKENLNEAKTFNVEHRIKIGKVEMPLLLEIVPQRRMSKTFIFIKGYKMDESKNTEDLLSYSMQYKRLFHSSYYGICNVEIEKGKKKRLGLINEYLRTIIQLNYKTCDEFLELPVLKDVIVRRVMQHQTITLRENKEKEKQFILCAFPVFFNGIITTIHICLFQEEKKRGGELLTSLTKREKEILSLASKGLTNRYISEKLSITEGTVKKTIYRGYKKLNIATKLELVELFREMEERVEFQ